MFCYFFGIWVFTENVVSYSIQKDFWDLFAMNSWTSCKKWIHLRNLRWNPKKEIWKMMFLFHCVMFRLHVNFQGCNCEQPA